MNQKVEKQNTNMNNKIKKISFYTFLAFVVLSNFVFGQTGTVEYLGSIVVRVVNVVVSITWAIIVLFAIYVAYLYLSAGGDEKKVDKAKNALIYLIIALAVLIGITLIKNVLSDLFGTEPIFEGEVNY